MSVIEENVDIIQPPKLKRKKRKESPIMNENDVQKLNDNIPPHEEGSDNPPAVRKKRKKTDKLEKVAGETLPDQPTVPETKSPMASDVNENVESVPVRMKRKKARIAELENIVDQCVEQISKSKKVSFNDDVASFSIQGKKRSKLKIKQTTDEEQLQPKSILKHTEFSNVISKEKTKKSKGRKAKVKPIPVPPSKKSTSKGDKAILYLERWKNDKSNWKFEKLPQTWLLKNMFDSSVITDEKFSVLLEYVTEMTGCAVTLATQLSENIIKEMEQKSLVSDTDENLESSYQRARSILQYLK